jgi:hypothetical protein
MFVRLSGLTKGICKTAPLPHLIGEQLTLAYRHWARQGNVPIAKSSGDNEKRIPRLLLC